jgi:hypothetical protein
VLIDVNPSLRVELLASFPEKRTPVNRPRTEDYPGADGDVFSCYGGVAHCFSDRGRHCWVEAEDFLADAVEEREGF